ncbi:proline-rich protein 36-like [Eriocheir sinensis]|uniref:proline-rich protein 36-like n=1 Tax=Eriocheir sinensis TaxID=95602 RepID=UPI0021C7BD10|nr:proline-rich protein 36-like [Eriocheir sinensis]XP_050730762.1 proline-rich protein 36-like [Eriocheir sinensis]
MIVTPSYSREVGDGPQGRLVGGRVPSLGLPDPPSAAFKPEVGGVFKGGLGSAFDHNKNSVSDKDGGGGGGLGPLQLGHHLQPFTAPWLAEVAHITPAPRPDHLPFPQPPTHPLPDYYPHFPSLAHRPPGYYPHPFLPPASSSHFLRDFQRHAHRPYPPLDPRPPLERPTPVSGAASLVRPLGPPSLRGLHPDPRDLREAPHPAKLRPRPPDLTLPVSPSGPAGEPSPRGPHGEPSPKRRAGGGAFPMPAPRSPRAAPRALSGPAAPAPGPGPPVSSPVGPATSGAAAPTIPTTAASAAASTSTTPSAASAAGSTAPPPATSASSSTPAAAAPEPRPASPYHAHFARGALVTVGASVRRVEDLETRDFLEAARAAEDLMLHPSTVAAITTTPARPHSSTITFTFPATNSQVSVEAALEHPFFVFHRGWSSVSPERTLLKYELKVRLLQVGDVCVSLTKKVPGAEPPQPPPPPAQTQAQAPDAQDTPGTDTTTQATPTTTTTSTSSAPSTSTTSSAPSTSTDASASSPAPAPAPAPAPQPSSSPPPAKTTGEDNSSPPANAADPRAWGRPATVAATSAAASRTGSGRQHSSDEAAQREDKDGGRKRRWSDPGQTT